MKNGKKHITYERDVIRKKRVDYFYLGSKFCVETWISLANKFIQRTILDQLDSVSKTTG